VTERELIDQLCDLRPTWAELREQIHEERAYFEYGTDFGRELVGAILAGEDLPWMRGACAVIERAIEHGNEATKGLVVTGMFESMQNRVYAKANPPDLMDDWLGPHARMAWADLIEGWTGQGVRTVEAWRRVVINGSRTLVTFESSTLWFHADLGAHRSVRWRFGGVASGDWKPTKDEAERIVQPLRPLLAISVLDEPPTFGPDAEYARLTVDGAQGPSELVFGPAISRGWLASDGTRGYLIDLDRLVNGWRWITEPR
jgi:hypothetical protein